MTVQHRLRFFRHFTGRPDDYECSPLPDCVLVVLRLMTRYPHVGEGAQHSARGRAHTGPGESRGNRTRGKNRTDTGERDGCQSQEKPCNASGRRALGRPNSLPGSARSGS